VNKYREFTLNRTPAASKNGTSTKKEEKKRKNASWSGDATIWVHRAPLALHL